jgi:hypothetical protein
MQKSTVSGRQGYSKGSFSLHGALNETEARPYIQQRVVFGVSIANARRQLQAKRNLPEH